MDLTSQKKTKKTHTLSNEAVKKKLQMHRYNSVIRIFLVFS